MKIIMVVLLSFTAAFLWVFISLKKEDIRGKDLILTFLFSCLSAAAVIFFQFVLGSIQREILGDISFKTDILIKSFISAAFVEEAVKAVLFFLLAKIILKKEQKKVSLSFLSVFYGLIFASFENIAYSVVLPQIIIVRLFTATVLHGCLGIYYAKSIQKKNIGLLFIPWLYHGFYNMFLGMGGHFYVFSIFIVFYALYSGVRIYTTLKKTA